MATGFKKRVLVPALMEPGPMDVGLTVREAWAVINAIFDSIRDAILRHEQVELPIGTFTVEQNPEKRRAWKFGQVTVLYAHRYRVEFLSSGELNLAAAAAPPSPSVPKQKRRKKEIVKTELTIATELIVEFILKNVQGGNVTLFFKELSDTAPGSFALFERTLPQSHELRPLDDAAQVIAECASKEMPQDPWDHLYACLEWFARWSQRVIPPTVWQDAMKAARKILLPKS